MPTLTGKQQLEAIAKATSVVRDFPKKRINFRDISSVMIKPDVMGYVFELMAAKLKIAMNAGVIPKITAIVGLESRGFIFAVPLAQMMNLPFAMIRKPNKMPRTIEVNYGLEYGTDVLTIQKDLLPEGSNVLIVDDLIATGGSAEAACRLIEMVRCIVAGIMSLYELTGIDRKPELAKYKVFSLIKCPADSEDMTVCNDDVLPFCERVKHIPFNQSPDDRRVIVFSHPNAEDMANKIVTSSKLFRHGSIKWGRFPGGNPNILFENQEYLNNKDVVYCMSGKLSDVSEEESFLIALCRQGIKSLQIHMPYYGVATMERVGKKNIVATAETIAKMISTPLLSTKTGKPILIIHDMHALPVRFYFPDTVTVKPQTAIDILLEILKTTHPDIVIAFPDDGAYKRFAEYFEGFRMIVCAKARKGDERVVTIFKKENWPKDDSVCREHVIIIDDLTRSGGTIEECEKALKKEGFENVSAYVTHAAFDRPEDYQKFFTENGGKFHKFYTTDSIQDNAREIKGHAPFEVIELGTHSAREILKECDLPWHKLEEQKTINVYVASTNETKMGAVYDVISKANEGCIVNVYGVEDISSGVSEQPIGLETHQGSKNRLANLQEWVKYHGYEYDYLVSIENGIDLNIQSNSDTQATQAETPSDAQATQSDAQATQSEASSEPFDFCVISMRKAGSVYMNESTLRTYIGRVQHLIDQSVKLGKTVTVGSMIEKEFAYLKGAWHKHFGPHTRYDMITDTLLRTLGDVKSQ